MARELPKQYDASKVEDALYQRWEASGFFNPDKLPGKRKKAFSIAMPPPNATGILHIGHAMFLTIQDIVIRYQRLLGKKTLWLPGVDHAAIATQAKVEKMLKDEGKTKYDLGRGKFLERVRQFVKTSSGTIRKQIRKMGSSCDWSRERFTLDEGLSLAVREAFVRMYNDGLIYRGERIVNWCPRCESTLSDDEVEYVEQRSPFYYFRYGPVIIGTARPETKFLDKTIVVHLDDKRYRHLVGKSFEVEWIDGKIQASVIADSVIDMNFGTGAMTITPAHSFEDFELAKKYHLPIEKIIDEKGNLTQAAGGFAGKNARGSRAAIVEILRKKKLLEKIDENYVHRLSVCYRCDTPVEPLPKDQWWVDVNKRFKIQDLRFKFPKKEASLKELALWVVKSGQIKIIPERFEKIYFHWMENLRDWCISRQIWYGHRIPVWYRRKLKVKSQSFDKLRIDPEQGRMGQKLKDIESEIYVGVELPHGVGWEQDHDTLDTWFSSGLWTFSTLGWPASAPLRRGKPVKTGDLQAYHPTSLMETGYDTLFFWVARMILMSLYHIKEVPFRDVYLHGLVLDEHGKKMSKSLGNAIDPLEVCAQYGTDAVRLSLTVGTAPGNDLNLGETKIAGFRNFTNKLWNIARFVFLSVENIRRIKKPPKPQTAFDEWILQKFYRVIEETTRCLDTYQFSRAGEILREFTWGDFADWYLEVSKILNPPSASSPLGHDLSTPSSRPRGIEAEWSGPRDKSQIPNKFQITNSKKLEISHDILLYILERLLILWHPFMPYVTETIFQNFSDELLMVQKWPKAEKKQFKKFDEAELVQSVIVAVRNLKAQHGLQAKKDLRVYLVTGKLKLRAILERHIEVIQKLAGVGTIDYELSSSGTRERMVFAMVQNIEIRMPFSDIINIEDTRRNITEKEAYVKSLEARIQDKNFLEKAPKFIVEKEKQKLETQKAELEKMKRNLEHLL